VIPNGRDNTFLLFALGTAIPATIFLAIQLSNDPDLFAQTLLKGLGLGSVYATIALGFVLIFKATQTVNFAQGALGVSGALFLSFMVADDHIPFTTIANPLTEIGGPAWVPWALSLAVALVFAAGLGLVVERLAIRPMIGQPLFSVAVITLGLEIVLRTFNNDTSETEFRSLALPWGVSDGFRIGDSLINWSFIVAMITAAVAFAAVYFFYRSRLGIAMRAVAFDQEAAMAQGINVGRVFAIAWGAGAVLAAVGVIMGTQPPVKQTGAIDPDVANIAFRALPAVVLGGLDSAAGALLGGVIIGLAEIFAGQYAAGLQGELGAGYPLIIPYIVMIVGLLVRPYGLFGTPEIRRV
jgi:branched-chain amino acid transport system permease protein